MTEPITNDQLADLLAIANCMTGVGDGYSYPGKLTPGQAILALHARLENAEKALRRIAWTKYPEQSNKLAVVVMAAGMILVAKQALEAGK